MAQLAQVRLLLALQDVSPSQIERLGRIADEAAAYAARSVYGDKVEIDVVLQEGSILTKVTVIGGLLIGVYHATGSYPDFKDGMAMLCDDASKYSQVFVNNFIKSSGLPPSSIESVTSTAKTPKRIKKLIEKLEKLDKEAKSLDKLEVTEELAKAKTTTDALIKDISDDEAEHLKSQLRFKNLPQMNKWPTRVQRPKSRAPTPSEYPKSRGSARAPRKARILYHHRFIVSP